MLVDSNILIYATKPEHAKLRQWLIDTLYVDEDRKTSLQEAGYLLVRIYHIPKPDSVLVFVRDDSDRQVCVHFSRASDTSWPEWTQLKVGDEMAIRIDPTDQGNKTPKASEAILFAG